MENVKNDAICHITRQNQYNPAGGGATKMPAQQVQLFLLYNGKLDLSNQIAELSQLGYNDIIICNI